MSRLICVSLCSLLSFSLQANCLRGNCNTGNGTTKLKNGSKYSGEFKAGKPHGKGIMYYLNGNKYLGTWQSGNRHGKGKLIIKGQGSYVGSFKSDLVEGYGEFSYQNGDIYKGYFKNGKYHGTGTYTYSKGKVITGSWHENELINNTGTNKPTSTLTQSSPAPNKESNSPKLKDCNNVYCHDCSGNLVYNSGNVYTGQFRNGKPNGSGKVTQTDGTIIHGVWKNNKLIKKIRTTKPTHIATAPPKKNSARPTSYRPSVDQQESYPAPAYSKEVKIYAVIVGVAAYNSMPSLRYTDDDAYKIYAFLKSPEGGALPDSQIKVLIDDSATKKGILDSMEELFAKADKNDMVMLYFSGHGLAGSFIPHDFDGVRNRINHTDIEAIFQKSNAKHKVVYADACYSGSYEVGEKSISNIKMKDFYTKLDNTSSSTALMMSSRKHEISLEFLGLKQGVFSHFLIKGLGGEADEDKNKIVSMDELFSYVKNGVREYTGYTQTPVIMGNYSQNMPVSIVR